jgi:hypothetical protein
MGSCEGENALITGVADLVDAGARSAKNILSADVEAIVV